MEENQNQEEHLKITINGQEYDPTEAQDFIEAGRKTRELEKQYNTSLDKVWPGYGQAKGQVSQLERELSEARSQIEEFKSKQQAGTDTNADLAEAKEAARRLGIPLKEDLDKEGYIRKDQLDSFLEERLSQRDAVNKILKEADTLESKYDGSDGRPKFNKKVVLAYAQAYGQTDLEAAYRDMHADTLSAWEKQQIAARTKPGLNTLASQRGNKQPGKVAVNKDNAGDLLSEALWGSKQE